MTAVAGFLTGYFGPGGLLRRPIGLEDRVERETFVYNFPPWGALIAVNDYPDREMTRNEMRAFLRKIHTLLLELRRVGIRDTRMAVTWLWHQDTYELREVGRALSPDSFEDWLVLDGLSSQNYERERQGKTGLLVATDLVVD